MRTDMIKMDMIFFSSNLALKMLIAKCKRAIETSKR